MKIHFPPPQKRCCSFRPAVPISRGTKSDALAVPERQTDRKLPSRCIDQREQILGLQPDSGSLYSRSAVNARGTVLDRRTAQQASLSKAPASGAFVCRSNQRARPKACESNLTDLSSLPKLARNGHGVMSDLSPLCAAKRTSLAFRPSPAFQRSRRGLPCSRYLEKFLNVGRKGTG